MQMFGIGIAELMVILILTVLVVGPDKMPQLAADLGRWIRQTRAYAKHLMGDFNEVVSELEKEAGASREDWQEIANLVRRNSGAVGSELARFGRDIEEQERELTDVDALRAEQPNNGLPADKNTSAAEEEDQTEDLEIPVPSNGNVENGHEPGAEEEKPWYVPERASRRRSSE